MERKSILLVDDELIIALATKSELENNGYLVKTVSSGKAAIEYFNSNDDIDLILMDIDLGKGIDGPATAKEILKTKDIPVLFLSSHSEKAVIERTETITSYGYVVKGSDITVLDASIKLAMKLFDANCRIRQNEQQLRENNARLETIINTIPGMVSVIDSDFNIQLANQQSVDILDIPDRKRPEGKKCYAVRHGLDRICDGCVVQKALESGKMETRIVYHDKNSGSGPKSKTYAVPLIEKDGKITGAVEVILDISDLKKDFELDNLEDQLKITQFGIEKAQIGIFQVSSSGALLYVNQKGCENLGYTREELLKLKIWDIDPTVSEKSWIEGRKNNIQLAHKTRYSKHCRKDGSIFPVEIVSNYIDVHSGRISFSFVKDLTREFNDRKKIKENEERLELALEGTDAGLWDWNLGTNEIKVDQRWAAILGYMAYELSPVSSDIYKEFCSEETLKERNSRLKQHFNGKKPFYKCELEMTDKSGSRLWVMDSGKVSERDGNGNPLRITGTMVDISRQKAREQEIHKLVHEKELLLKEVNHRVKNNLMMMKSLLMLQGAKTENPAAKEVLQEAQDRLSVMLFLYQHLNQTESTENVDLSTVLSFIIRNIQQTYSLFKKIRISSSIDKADVNANHAINIGIILNELLTNAYKYAFPEGEGIISIELKNHGANELKLFVKDTGCGMKPSEMNESEYGFGLQMVTALTRQMNGSLKITGKNGTGIEILLKTE